jgi:asparagine synthase (glutamine-hydrolysing)
LLAVLPEGKHHPLLEVFRRARRFADTGKADPIGRHAGWMRLIPEHELDALFAPAPAVPTPLEERIAGLRASVDDEDPINAMLACDVALELPADMLVKVDRMSMAHALETRAPFLDQRVVEWAFGMPGSDKLALVKGRPVGKRVLREAFRDRLPAEVFSRPKRGFEMPVAQLLAGPAANRLAAATERGALIGQGLFDPDVVQGWKDDLAAGRRDTAWHLWTVLAFQEWARLHQRPEAAVR